MTINKRSGDGAEFELLIEIAGLLRRYGPKAFEELASHLSEPHFRDHLISLLIETAAIGREARASEDQPSGEQGARNEIEPLLVELERREPDKAKLLREFHRDVMTKRVFPTSRDLQEFIEDLGLSLEGRFSRNRAVLVLVKALSILPNDDLEKKLAATKSARKLDDRSLQGWSDIILATDRRTKR